MVDIDFYFLSMPRSIMAEALKAERVRPVRIQGIDNDESLDMDNFSRLRNGYDQIVHYIGRIKQTAVLDPSQVLPPEPLVAIMLEATDSNPHTPVVLILIRWRWCILLINKSKLRAAIALGPSEEEGYQQANFSYWQFQRTKN